MGVREIASSVKTRKKMIGDFAYNIAATGIATIVLQIVVYPYLASFLSADVYGELLTIIGVANIFLVSVGGGLNNARLIQNSYYEEQRLNGDFNLILSVFSALGTILFLFVAGIQYQSHGITLVFLGGYVLLGIIQNYWIVSYRLVVDYKANLIYNIIVSLGYVGGILLISSTEWWSVVFFLGQATGLLYLIKTTRLFKEGYRVTKMFSGTLKVYIVLILTNVIANVVVYLDRIFLYPIMGGEQVTVYTVSSFVGKCVGLVVTPMAGVLLSYYAQKTFRMTLKKYWMINGIVLIGGGIMGMVAILIAPFVTSLLYPTVVNAALEYIVVANVASLIGVLANILAPSVLKFANISWQIVIQIVYAIAYMGLGSIFMKQSGLAGFCIATLLVNLIRMLLLIVIGHVSIYKGEKVFADGKETK